MRSGIKKAGLFAAIVGAIALVYRWLKHRGETAENQETFGKAA